MHNLEVGVSYESSHSRVGEEESQTLSGGPLNAVACAGGEPYLRRDAQEQLRASKSAQGEAAETQTAILNALPAHVALIDPDGIILAVNESWRRFATANLLQSADFGVGQNYLDVCGRASGDCADDAQAAANGMPGSRETHQM